MKIFMQIRCNFPDISYLSETQKNTFQFLTLQVLLASGQVAVQPDRDLYLLQFEALLYVEPLELFIKFIGCL